ncbi:transcriptional regulator [Pseudovibrio sp. Tun.PSC04-5.I4]|uniref:transcriptional regulator n=1 Tax=Pseudovibrio sp. Tun.PSC04-5.I4 TaxID=1798213 RepID=UPI00087FDD25|nr:transcriptional regulator [Pseudovibrio sp. Tun.PSC04-5.I4]SDQ83808.1 transcriptional regulator, TetR family [Pseudovibrio sp. Tun.PSC04-5.I4]
MAGVVTNRNVVLDSAECMIRESNLSGLNLKQLASMSGTNEQDIAVMFPANHEIELAVLQRYIDRFLQILGDPTRQIFHFRRALDTYIAAFQAGMTDGGELFISAVLGDKNEDLPVALQELAATFARRNRVWLADLLEYSGNWTSEEALVKSDFVLAAMEVAVLMGHTSENPEIFANLSLNIHHICMQ